MLAPHKKTKPRARTFRGLALTATCHRAGHVIEASVAFGHRVSLAASSGARCGVAAAAGDPIEFIERVLQLILYASRMLTPIYERASEIF